MSGLCQTCLSRPAISATSRRSMGKKRGQFRSLAGHDLCRSCWRSVRIQQAVKPSRGRMDGVLDDLMAAAEAEKAVA